MERLQIGFTDKEITPWGGLVLLQQMLKQMSLKEEIENNQYIPHPGSNRGYKPYTIIESFITSVWCGANRYMHTEITRQDKTIRDIFGWEQPPGQDTYKRFFSKHTQAINTKVFGQIYSWFFDNLRFDNFTIDFDSTVITRYGEQQGAKKGYNPKKPGRKSHHPLMAFIDDCWMVANFWLRSGNAYTSENFVEFLEGTLNRLQNKTVGLVRLDSGFYDGKVFDYLEEHKHSYIVAVKFYEPIQRLLSEQHAWFKLDEGVEIAQSTYQSPSWDKSRRIVMVRQYLPERPKASGKKLQLFKDDNIYKRYRYSCYITNMSLSAPEIWRLYRQRGNAENRIKELKYDFGFDSFNMQNFWGTEASLNYVMLAYNLMSLFRQSIINSKTQERMSTHRFKTFAIGAYLVKDGRNTILKLSLKLKRREWFTGLWNSARNFSLPVYFSNA